MGLSIHPTFHGLKSRVWRQGEEAAGSRTNVLALTLWRQEDGSVREETGGAELKGQPGSLSPAPCPLPGWWRGLLYIITYQKCKCNTSACCSNYSQREKNIAGVPPDVGECLAAALESYMQFSAHIFCLSQVVSYLLCLFCLTLPEWGYGIAKCISIVRPAYLALRGEQWHSLHHPVLKADYCRVLRLCLRIQKTLTAESDNNRKIITN